MPQAQVDFVWQPTLDADGYILSVDGVDLPAISTVGHSVELDLAFGPHNFGIRAFNSTGFGPATTIQRMFDDPTPPPIPVPIPGAVEGFDVFMQVTNVAVPPTGVAGNNAARINAILDLYTVPAAYSAVEKPDDPVTSGAPLTVTDDASMSTALAAGNGKTWNVSAASYSGITLNGLSDIDIICADDAIVDGVTVDGNGGANTRVRWTGGRVNQPTAGSYGLFFNYPSSHMHFHNVHFGNGGGVNNNESNGTQSHLAFTQCTIDTPSGAGGYPMLPSGVDHLIVAGFLILNAESTNAGLRATGLTNTMFVGGRLAHTGGNKLIRIHAHPSYATNLVLWSGVQFEGPGGAGDIQWKANAGDAGTNRITNVDHIDCTYYSETSTFVGAVMDVDEASNATGAGDDGVENLTVNGFDCYSPESTLVSGGGAGYSETGVTLQVHEAPPSAPASGTWGADHT